MHFRWCSFFLRLGKKVDWHFRETCRVRCLSTPIILERHNWNSRRTFLLLQLSHKEASLCLVAGLFFPAFKSEVELFLQKFFPYAKNIQAESPKAVFYFFLYCRSEEIGQLMNPRHLSQESNSLPLDHHHNPLKSFTNKVVRTDNITVLISVATRTASTLN